MDAIRTLAEYVVASDRADLPPPAVDAVKTFVLDSFGVAIAGSRGPWVGRLIETAALSGQGAAARVWNSGAPLPAPAAALCIASWLLALPYCKGPLLDPPPRARATAVMTTITPPVASNHVFGPRADRRWRDG